jgi:hypothetical protein
VPYIRNFVQVYHIVHNASLAISASSFPVLLTISFPFLNCAKRASVHHRSFSTQHTRKNNPIQAQFIASGRFCPYSCSRHESNIHSQPSPLRGRGCPGLGLPLFSRYIFRPEERVFFGGRRCGPARRFCLSCLRRIGAWCMSPSLRSGTQSRVVCPGCRS